MNQDGLNLQSVSADFSKNPELVYFVAIFLFIAIGTLIFYFYMHRRRTLPNRPKAFHSIREAKISFDRNLKFLLNEEKEVELPYRPVADKLPPLRSLETNEQSPK